MTTLGTLGERRLTRRGFLRSGAFGLGSLPVWGGLGFAQGISPNDKLNIAVIGVANQGRYNLNNVASQNIVALCDVDATHLAAAAADFPQAKKYRDFRRLLEQPDLDAVVVATPDHTHAVATMGALRSGRHVYCEKPLARTISETRAVTEAAKRYRRVTQIGTQIHAGNNYRRVVELIQTGAIGPVREVHVWVGASYGGKDLPTKPTPVPSALNYDLWLGPVPYRPFFEEYHPQWWRHWWAFGGGALADFGCHFMDLPHWALGLSVPRTAEVVDGPPRHQDSTPPWLIVRYEYPAREPQPPVALTWYHGGRKPEGVDEDSDFTWQSGVLFVGEKGRLISDYTRHVLLPKETFAGFKAPSPFIPDSIGHHREWIEACKHGGKTTCSFDYSGPLTEAALLGNVAYRVGERIDWNAEAMQARGCPGADEYIRHAYRDGWSL